MKKMMLILAMLLIAATSYNQTSRRSTNERTTANKPVTRETRTTSERTTRNNNATVTRSSQTTTHPKSRAAEPRTTTTTRTRTVTVQDNNNGRTQHSPSRETSRTRQDNNRSTTHTSTTVNRTTQTRTGGTRTTTTPSREVVKVNSPRRSQPARTVEYASPRVYRSQHAVRHTSHRAPHSVEYRRTHYAYRRPAHIEVYWTPVMHRHYVEIYPMVRHWRYRNGYRIEAVSAYDAMYYRGEVATVYGRVKDVFYSRETDEYFLYFGLYYPHQDFTAVIPGYLARRYNHRPQRYFTNRYMAITGLITTFNGDPEIVVKRDFQINLY